MISSIINSRKVPREMFQHLPRDLANVNEWKLMFDPYIQNVQLLLSSKAVFLVAYAKAFDCSYMKA